MPNYIYSTLNTGIRKKGKQFSQLAKINRAMQNGIKSKILKRLNPHRV